MTDGYDRAPVGLATIARDGRIVMTNAAFRRLIGPETLAGEPRFHELLRIGDRIFWDTHLGPLLEMQGHVREIAVEVATDAGPLPALLNASTERPGDPAGTVDIALFPARDRRTYESELLAARKRAEQSEARARLLAETLQQSLIPPRVPDVPGLDLGVAYRPAGADIGGDFYDFFRVTPSAWCVAVGDVSGKGAAAAAVAALARYTIRGVAVETDDIAEALYVVNRTLILEGRDDLCTVVLARVAAAGDRHQVTLAAAGAPLPRLVPAAGDVTSAGKRGPLLGAFDDATHGLGRVSLRSGDALVVVTDGVLDARRRDEFFGEARLDALLAEQRALPPPELAASIIDAAGDFQGEALSDDAAAVVLRAAA